MVLKSRIFAVERNDFGKMVTLQEVESQIIIDYEV